MQRCALLTKRVLTGMLELTNVLQAYGGEGRKEGLGGPHMEPVCLTWLRGVVLTGVTTTGR